MNSIFRAEWQDDDECCTVHIWEEDGTLWCRSTGVHMLASGSFDYSESITPDEALEVMLLYERDEITTSDDG